jgi:PAS domain S-box-containing protein
LQGLDADNFKWSLDRFKKLFPLNLPRVSDLPKEAKADKKWLKSRGIRSHVSVPVAIGGNLLGFLELNSINMERTWSDDIINMLQISAEIFAYALERTKAQEVLSESEEQFRSLAEQSPNMIFINIRGAIVYANEKCEDMMGYTREEFYSPEFDFISLIAPESRELVKKSFSGHLKGKELPPYEYTLVTNEGKKIVGIISTKLISYQGERAILGVVTDITTRKQAEEKIKELKEFNESIIQSMAEGIMILDEEGIISFINPNIEKALGYKRAKLVGEHWESIMAPDYHRRMRDGLAENLKGENDRFESVLLKKNLTELPVMISASPQIRDGINKGMLAVITDISERKREEFAREELMRYKIKRGTTYLVKEKNLERGKDVVVELYKNQFKGLIITREHPEKIKREIDLAIPIFWLTKDPKDKNSVKPEFPLLEKIIDDYIDRTTFVLLDRFDYLVTQYSFKEALNFIQHLNEMFYSRKAILIISLDPGTLTSQELSLLEKETTTIEKKHEERLSSDALDLLEYVNKRNIVGESPSYKHVGDEFRISRTTTRKRIKELVDKGLLSEKKSGRFKHLILTDKGKESLQF